MIRLPTKILYCFGRADYGYIVIFNKLVIGWKRLSLYGMSFYQRNGCKKYIKLFGYAFSFEWEK